MILDKIRKSYAFHHKNGLHNFCITKYFFKSFHTNNFAANK